jgi:hypothetical protein
VDGYITFYSVAALTVQSDSLKAISGVITAIQKRTDWKNLAGLGEPFLWAELLWQRSLLNPGHSTGLSPTWSWISISGEIALRNKSRFLIPISSVSEAESIVLDDLEGEIGARLRMALHVSCLPVQISGTNDVGPRDVNLIGCFWTARVIYTPDSLSRTKDPELFLPLAAYHGLDLDWQVVGVAVSRSVSCPGAFERVGHMWFRRDNDLERSEILAFSESSRRKTILLI